MIKTRKTKLNKKLPSVQRFILVFQTSITPTFSLPESLSDRGGNKNYTAPPVLLSHAGRPHTRTTRDSKCKLPSHIQFLAHTHTRARARPWAGLWADADKAWRGVVSDSVLGNPSGQLGQWLKTASCLPCPHKSHAVDPPVFTTQGLQSVRH